MDVLSGDITLLKLFCPLLKMGLAFFPFTTDPFSEADYCAGSIQEII